MDLEFCIESYEAALAADAYCIKRVELCSALLVGGLTPSFGLIKRCCELNNIEVHCMIRPRSGDFVYNSSEIEIMRDDIAMAAQAGARGVVFGILTSQGKIDRSRTAELAKYAQTCGLETTFHRAFDFSQESETALETLISCGITRLLTSGKANKAVNGIPLLRQLVQRAMRRIQIMAGSGVNAENIKKIQSTGIDAVHFTVHKSCDSTSLSVMGRKYSLDQEKIKTILKAIKG